MQIVTIAVAFILTFFATAVNSYIALATSLGPWIEPTLVLGGMLIMGLFKHFMTPHARAQSVGLATAAGGLGGIMAIAAGFSFPTLFFLDKTAFSGLMGTPFSFALVLSSLACSAGLLGFMLATVCEHTLIVKEELPFPIGELVYKMISAAESMRQALSLATGFAGSLVFHVIRLFSRYIPEQFILMQKYSLTVTTLPKIAVHTDLLPLFLAIGFVTGHMIAAPLAYGFLANILVIGPLHYFHPSFARLLSSFSWFGFAESLSLSDFTIAFCSGMVVYGAITGFFDLPKIIKSVVQKFFAMRSQKSSVRLPWFLIGSSLLVNVLFLKMLNFSFLGIGYLMSFTLICAYQMMVIAGKIGLAPLGRFATFVVVPGMLLFGYTPLQITIVSTYVEMVGGVACDVLFGRKMGYLASIKDNTIVRYQAIGLFVSSLAIGLIFWLLISHFGLGNEAGALPASRAAFRALLVNVQRFDTLALLFGMLFAFLLKFTKINSTLMLGGILMPPEYSLLLVIGGLMTNLVKDKEAYYPFWSGVFAASSLWMLVKAFF